MKTKRYRVAGMLTVVVLLSWTPGECDAADVALRRQKVYSAAARGPAGVPVLGRALRDKSPLVRRAAVRALADLGAPARRALTVALGNDDPVVRRAALLALVGEPAMADLPLLERALQDADVAMRQSAVGMLLALQPRGEEVLELLRRAAADTAPEVQLPATLALEAAGATPHAFTVPLPDRLPLRQRPDMADHVTQIVTAVSIPLPRDGWRFRIDPAVEGHVHKWFEPDCDDSAWSEAFIETPWMEGYVGVGWYRREIHLPERPEHLGAELVFEGVDESAWVWVNGVYVGGQDIGPDGWDQPFRVDVTEELRWNGPNQITVRAMNTAYAGGIWKPVRLDALKMN